MKEKRENDVTKSMIVTTQKGWRVGFSLLDFLFFLVDC